MTGTHDGPAAVCAAGQGSPTCSTGPIGRLIWTAGQLRRVVRRRAREDHDAR